MEVAIPHNLGKAEVRRRLSSHSHEIADHVPGGMAEVTTAWRNEDCMTMEIAAMGQTLSGAVEIEDDRVLFQIELPAALSFVRPMIEGAIRHQGEKLLAPPKD